MNERHREPAIASLVIGLGGVGVRALRHLKQMATSHSELDARLLACFGIDTEPGMQHREANGLPPLADQELLVLDGLEVRRLCARLATRGDGRSLWPEIEAWLPDSGGLRLVDDLAPTGEALLRPLGRLVFWRYEDLIRTHVSRALRGLTVERGPARLEGVRRVVIVTSTGGGTGSGLLGELVELLRGYDDVVELVVALVMPAVPVRAVDETRADVRTPRRRRVEANTYACLKEIYHLQAGTLRWQSSAEAGARRQRRERWCERVYLSDDSTGAGVAATLAFHLLRVGQSRVSLVCDRVTDGELRARSSERRWSVFSFAAGCRVDLTPFTDPQHVVAPPAPPKAPPPDAVAAARDGACAQIDAELGALRTEVLKVLQALTHDARRLWPNRNGDRDPAGLVGDVLGQHLPGLHRGLKWEGAGHWAEAKHAIEGLLPQRRAALERYVRECAPAADDRRLDALRPTWTALRQADLGEERRGWIGRLAMGVMRSEVARRDEKLALALVAKALSDGGEAKAAFVARVTSLLLQHELGAARAQAPSLAPEEPVVVAAPPAPPPAEERESLAEALEKHIVACRARVFELSGPRRERLGLCVAVVPRGRRDVEDILADRVPEILGCEVEVVQHDVNVAWLYHEDPFHEPKDIMGIESWYRTFTAEPHPELCFTDRRFLDGKPDFTELVGDEGLHRVSCGNDACRHDIRREARRSGVCPECGQWIRSRCGNVACTLENLHQQPQGKARSCPGCGGLNRAAWWACPRHGKIEHLVSVEKPRCPACIERHLNDPIGYPEHCIGQRPDVGRYRECPGCAARREQDPEHQSLLIGPDLLPFVYHGVNGHDHDRFVELAQRYQLDDEHLCPKCRCLLIPVHHVRMAIAADCEGSGDRAPRGFPIAPAPRLAASVAVTPTLAGGGRTSAPVQDVAADVPHAAN